MSDDCRIMLPRRRLISGVAAGALLPQLLLPVHGHAQGGSPAADGRGLRPATPAQSEGPFYPRELPLDRDNDLTRVSTLATPARGDITELTGTVTDSTGRPQAGLLVEIWQVNAFGRYHHPDDRRNLPLDPGFQGYGQFATDAQGRYRFRTIRPVSYPGRAPHVHLALSGDGVRRLTTQFYVAGAPENASDFLLNRVRDPVLRASLIVPFKPLAVPAGGATLTAHFDVVLARDGRFSLFASPRSG